MPVARRRESIPFVLVSCEHGTMIVNRLDWRRLNETTHEFGVGTSILTQGHSDLDLISMTGGMLLTARAARGDGVVALDIGANIGTFTVEWARNMAGWGSVVAFEPQDRIFYALAGNIAINNLFNVMALNVAVGEARGAASMPLPDYQQLGQFGALSLRGDGSDSGQPTTARRVVDVVAIDDLAITRIDFIKIDVEGMELEVLRGGLKAIGRHKPYMLIEWIAVGKEAIKELIDPLGYETVNVGMNMMCAPEGDPGLTRLRDVMRQNGMPE